MLKNTLTGLDKKKLRRWLLLFFFALAIPTAILIQQSYSRLKWETFHQHQLMADELSSRIDSELLRLIEIEEQRSFTDYSFLNIAGDPKANLLQRSPLSNYPIESEIAGLVGYFQIDNEGKLKTPLLPDAIKLDKSGEIYGIADKELASRTQLQNQIQEILSQNSLVKAPLSIPEEAIVLQDEESDGPRKTFDKDMNKSLARDQGISVGAKEETSSILSGLIGSSESRTIRPSLNYDTSSGTTSGSASGFESAKSYGSDAVVTEVVTESKQVEPNAQIAFDRLKTTAPNLAQRKNKLGRIEDLKFGKTYAKKAREQVAQKSKKDVAEKLSKTTRKEQNFLPERELAEEVSIKKSKAKASFNEVVRVDAVASVSTVKNISRNEELTVSASVPIAKPSKSVNSPSASKTNKPSLRISTFESSIDPFEFSQLDSGHFVLFRNVWLNEKRYIQGLLIEQKPFLENIVHRAFRKTSLAQMSDLLVSYQGNVLSAFSAQSSRGYISDNSELSGELLHQTRLSDPLSELQLLFSVRQLPVGSGGKIILWLSLLLGSVLCAGFYLMYRLGVGQINLANQQQDFVSAVSHELKTPLTSIRMYSEMLREGWANDEKKKTYYDFIFDESERLSRLINNVLHLARVTRNKQSPELKTLSVAELMDGIRSKVSTQINHAGFEFAIHCEEDVKTTTLEVDEDWFSQIMINLVDNAIKFSLKADLKKIELSCEKLNNNQVRFSVRDFGPGVDKAQMKKIFDLFYRTESELTRETVGTGIGLALVHQMTVSMAGKIDVVNREPGAEFRVLFSSY